MLLYCIKAGNTEQGKCWPTNEYLQEKAFLSKQNIFFTIPTADLKQEKLVLIRSFQFPVRLVFLVENKNDDEP